METLGVCSLCQTINLNHVESCSSRGNISSYKFRVKNFATPSASCIFCLLSTYLRRKIAVYGMGNYGDKEEWHDISGTYWPLVFIFSFHLVDEAAKDASPSVAINLQNFPFACWTHSSTIESFSVRVGCLLEYSMPSEVIPKEDNLQLI